MSLMMRQSKWVSSLKGNENLRDDLSEDLDSYWEHIKERLIISKMVSDSVIKGIVNAVEQEAAEKIASKEFELANLKNSLHLFGVDDNAFVEHDNVRESLESLKNVACEEFKKLKQEINGMKEYNSIRKISSGILRENENGSWVCVDKTLDRLESVVHAMCATVGDVVRSSKKSIQEMEVQREVEAMVIQSSIRSFQEEFGEKFWDRNASFCGNQSSVNWLEKFEEISCLRKELDAILKLLPNQETGQLISHGSYDLDHSNSPSRLESNGHDESKTGVPDKFDAAQFPHTSKQELVKFFNSTITQMKREHESIVQLKTEQYYHLKAKYLNERGSSLLLRKDKESDVLRKKLLEVIMKLDDILVENEKFPAFNDNVESLGSLKNRLDNLLSENQQLRDLITDKENEVKCLSLQFSDAAEIVLEHNLAKANLVKLVENLELSKEDANIEASVCEDVYKCVIKELSGRIERDNEESYRVLLVESGRKNERIGECDEIEDLDMEYLIMQGPCKVIYGEAIKEAEEQVKELNKELLIANESRAKLEREALEREKEFRLELEEKEKLKEKEKLREKLSVELKSVKEQLKFASRELHKSRDHTNSQEKLILERSEEFNVAKAKLLEAVEQGEVYKMEINGLNEKLEVAMEELKKADEVRKMVLVLSREKENVLSQFEMQEKERARQMEAQVVLVNELAEKIVSFKSKVREDIKVNNSRLQTSRYQLSYLIKKVNDLVRTESLCKQRLQRRCSDLEMAEAEAGQEQAEGEGQEQAEGEGQEQAGLSTGRRQKRKGAVGPVPLDMDALTGKFDEMHAMSQSHFTSIAEDNQRFQDQYNQDMGMLHAGFKVQYERYGAMNTRMGLIEGRMGSIQEDLGTIRQKLGIGIHRGAA